ncbi:MAG: tripartite tricarboxylate transporter substrate binding protein [Rubrivivax sp.]|nr:tripartite tricarboxylate transporter substrate binding protein [Rubrivivax sp.]
MDRRTSLQQLALSAMAVATGAALPGLARAQDGNWPNKPLRIVVPFAPGGSADVAARFIAPRLSERLGQTVTVDNRPGAGGTLAVGQVARNTPADGYTVVLAAAGALTISPHLNPSLGYDPVADLAPITGFARIPLVLIANTDVPAANADQLINLLRQQPGRFSYATTGNGSAMHLGGESFKALTDTFVVHIPYRGSAPAVAAVMAGEVQLAIVDLTSVLGRTEGTRIKVLALLGKQRSALAPALPTLAEATQGRLKEFDVNGWFGLFAPARTPAAVVQRLNTELTALLRADDLRERFKGFGIEPMPTTPQDLGQFLRTELGNYAGIVKRAGIKAE